MEVVEAEVPLILPELGFYFLSRALADFEGLDTGIVRVEDAIDRAAIHRHELDQSRVSVIAELELKGNNPSAIGRITLRGDEHGSLWICSGALPNHRDHR
jgi:hypothetical protein